MKKTNLFEKQQQRDKPKINLDNYTLTKAHNEQEFEDIMKLRRYLRRMMSPSTLQNYMYRKLNYDYSKILEDTFKKYVELHQKVYVCDDPDYIRKNVEEKLRSIVQQTSDLFDELSKYADLKKSTLGGVISEVLNHNDFKFALDEENKAIIVGNYNYKPLSQIVNHNSKRFYTNDVMFVTTDIDPSFHQTLVMNEAKLLRKYRQKCHRIMHKAHRGYKESQEYWKTPITLEQHQEYLFGSENEIGVIDRCLNNSNLKDYYKIKIKKSLEETYTNNHSNKQ